MDSLELSVTDGKTPNARTVTAAFTIDTDTGLLDKSDLGKTPQICKLCGASGDFQTWLAIEQFVGLRDEFRYFECPECESLQIEKFPENIEKYYAHDYYSFQPPKIKPVAPGVKRDCHFILDVGCGAGHWLCQAAEKGYVNLWGCDPFIDHDIEYENGVKIKKCSIHEMDGEYVFINLSHSFEHMSDPHETLESINRLLSHSTDACVDISIPIFPNTVFDIFGVYWHQLDAPRHYFLHSEKSMRMLARQHGFEVCEAEHGEDFRQFAMARMYQMGVPYVEIDKDPRYVHMTNNAYPSNIFKLLTRCDLAARHGNYAKFTLVRRR